MKYNFQTQVEVQGTKKLDSIKGVQALELNEMEQIEGGNIFQRMWNWIVDHLVPYNGLGFGIRIGL